MASSTSASIAQKTFEMENEMVTLDPNVDGIFRYDKDADRQAMNQKPWKTDPHFFKRVRISAIALIKMVMHARSGGIYEIMGLMQGKVDIPSQTIYIMDAFALPVTGTETRVNAAGEANEFMIDYLTSSQSVGRLENIIGWYHSHPGYGCWLSGIDVSTQSINQQYQDPFVAVVIDPNRTVSAGRVDIGAFRTYPEGYTPPSSAPSEYQSIPLNKIEDFGVHANSYYPLKVEHFKSTLDTNLLNLLWNKYWVNTLSQSPLLVNKAFSVGQVRDLGEKLNKAKNVVASRSNTTQSLPKAKEEENGMSSGINVNRSGDVDIDRLINETKKREDETPLAKATQDSTKISHEAQHGLISQVLKDILFNRSSGGVDLPPQL